MNIFDMLVPVALVATIFSLVAGISSMAHDGEVAQHNSGQWMVRRVAFQAATVVLILLSIYAASTYA